MASQGGQDLQPPDSEVVMSRNRESFEAGHRTPSRYRYGPGRRNVTRRWKCRGTKGRCRRRSGKGPEISEYARAGWLRLNWASVPGGRVTIPTYCCKVVANSHHGQNRRTELTVSFRDAKKEEWAFLDSRGPPTQQIFWGK